MKAGRPMTTRLRLFPLNAVLFPGAVLNLHVFEARYKQLIGECLELGESFGVVLIREGQEAGDPAVEPHDVGSVAEIQEVTQLPFGRFYVTTIGRSRFHIRKIVSREPYLLVEADLLEDDDTPEAHAEALREAVCDKFLEYLQLIVELGGSEDAPDIPADPSSASFIIADALQISDAIKQKLLELDDTSERLRVELGFLERLLPQLRAMIDRRAEELERRAGQGETDSQRAEQEKFFGKYFSSN
jgi:Lon protease-like protein